MPYKYKKRGNVGIKILTAAYALMIIGTSSYLIDDENKKEEALKIQRNTYNYQLHQNIPSIRETPTINDTSKSNKDSIDNKLR